MRKTKGKACYGTVEGRSYAFRVNGVDGADFFGLPFGRRLDALKKLMKFQEEQAKHVGYVDTKRRRGVQTAVKEWVRDNAPDQFFAFWNPELWDDSIEIFYTREDEEQK